MRPFSFLTPTDVNEAARQLAEHGADARVIAGGQTLLLALKERALRPSFLVSLGAIDELSGLRTGPDGELVIGATTTYAELSRAALPGWQAEIAAIAGNLADRPVRTMGTIGGALCAADPRFDMLTLVTGVDARLDVVGPDGVRRLSPAEFFDPSGGTTLHPHEILVSIHFPAADAYSRIVFRKFRQRTFDAALASVLVTVGPAGVEQPPVLRITVGAVTPVPIVIDERVGPLTAGPRMDDELDATGAAVATQVLGDAGDSALVQYQRELVRSLTREALRSALAPTRS